MIVIEPTMLDPRTRKRVFKDGVEIGTMVRHRTGCYAGNQMWEFTSEDRQTRYSAKTLRQLEKLVRERN